MSILSSIQFSEEDLITVSGNQVSSMLNEDESAILNFQTGTYYGLNQVGVSVWALLQEPKTFSQLCLAILNEYEVDEQSCKNDLQELVQGLLDVGLVTINHATA